MVISYVRIKNNRIFVYDLLVRLNLSVLKLAFTKPIDNEGTKKMEISNSFLLLLFFLFFTGLALFISGIKIDAENKSTKIISIVFGLLLIFGTLLIGILTAMNMIFYY